MTERVCKWFLSTRLAGFRVPQCHCDTLYSRYEAMLVCRSHTLLKWREVLQHTHILHSCLSAQSVWPLHTCVYESAKLLQSEMQFITASAQVLKAGIKEKRNRFSPYIIRMWFYHVLSQKCHVTNRSRAAG